MKPAGRSVTVLWSWFSSFKTDLETYIYITLQKAIYSLNAACLAAALVNLTPEPKPKNFLQPCEYVRATQEEAQGWTWLSSLCPQLTPLFRQILQDSITFCPTSECLDDMKAQIITSLTQHVQNS